jgi:hypothetical protein
MGQIQYFQLLLPLLVAVEAVVCRLDFLAVLVVGVLFLPLIQAVLVRQGKVMQAVQEMACRA